jgi:septum formation protein
LLPLYLASASPRRRELLAGLGIASRQEPAEVDERALPEESPSELPVRLAAAKAAAVASGLQSQGIAALVLAADTIVTIDGVILSKPEDEAEAFSMLKRLAGRRHDVITACRLVRTDDGRAAAALTVSGVRFAPWNEALARWYVRTGEPMDKAGAYGIQGLGVFLAEGIEGSWSNVVGLPLEALPALFKDVGDDIFLRMEA